MGMTVPESYGSQGFSYLDAVVALEEVAKACGVNARIVVEANTRAIIAIMAYGPEDQKKSGCGVCALRRQAGHLYYRTRRRVGGNANDNPGR